MNNYEISKEYLLNFFLTELSETTAASFVEDLSKDFLLRTHNTEWVEDFWDKLGDNFISDLVKEYNDRIYNDYPIYFTFIDELGTKVRGWKNPNASYDTSLFQIALLQLTDTEFESLSGRILQIAGCTDAWVTPKSHDQGLDAFGRYSLFNLPKYSSTSNLFHSWIIIQAKHYNKEMVCTSDIREFVGSVELAKHHTYAIKGKKYEQLDLKPFTPISYILITSGEVKRTTHLLAEKAGIFLLSSSDIYVIFSIEWGADQPTSVDKLVDKLRYESTLIPCC